MEVSKEYLDFYKKDYRGLKLPFKLTNEQLISNVIANMLNENNSCLSKTTFCLFNSISLTNYIRLNESRRIYLDEAGKLTLPTEKFIDSLFKFHANLFKFSKLIIDNLQKAQSIVEIDYPNDDNSIYGMTLLEFTVDLSRHDVKYYIEAISRKANLCNYNVVDTSITDTKIVEYNAQKFKVAKFLIQFEAVNHTNLDIDNVRYGYHVTTKNAADRIMKIGLNPRNQNAYEFKYPSRVYMFIVDDPNLFFNYAQSSKKVNAKFIDSDSLDDIMKSYKKIEKYENGKVFDTREFTILKIDLKKILNLSLYQDNAFEMYGKFPAAYTEVSIQPNAIERVKDFQYDI